MSGLVVTLVFSTIAFTRAPDASAPWPTTDIYVMNAADGSRVRALTRDGHSHHPNWSPDGRRLLFIHDSTLQSGPASPEPKEFATHHPVELQVMDADGGNRRLLRRIEPVIYSAAWSPDGKTIAVTCLPKRMTPAEQALQTEPLQAGLYLLQADGRGELRLLFRNAYTPAWSLDGKKLAFSVESPRGSWSVHVANADGSSLRRLTDPRLMGGSPAWSPDGKQIALAEFVGGRDQQIFLVSADGAGRRRQLTLDPAWTCDHPAWSADGSRIVFYCRSVTAPCGSVLPGCVRRIFALDWRKPGAKPVQLLSHDGADPAFSPAR